MGPFISSIAAVVPVFLTMLCITYAGVFENIEVEVNLDHYSEEAWLGFVQVLPLNTAVNFGYMALGLYWCAFTFTATHQGILQKYDSLIFYTFNIMAFMYGWVRLLRIVTQTLIWSVMDQWVTLPFFALLLVWALYLKNGWSQKSCIIIMGISVASYSLTLVSRYGFEICLGLHIVVATTSAFMVYRKYPAPSTLKSIYYALLACSGFVILHMLDQYLPTLFIGFKYVSGIFLSKVCDILQIQFVNDVFLDFTLDKAAELSVEDKIRFSEDTEQQEHFRKFLANDIMYEVPNKAKGQ